MKDKADGFLHVTHGGIDLDVLGYAAGKVIEEAGFGVNRPRSW